jgi:hypothetical protein
MSTVQSTPLPDGRQDQRIAMDVSDYDRAELQSRLEQYVLRFGAKRLLSIVRNLGVFHGQEV